MHFIKQLISVILVPVKLLSDYFFLRLLNASFAIGMIICFRHLTLPALPQGLQIMADLGFQNKSPLLLPISNNGNCMRGIMEK